MDTDDSVDVPLALEPSGSKLAVESCLVKLYLFWARGLGPSAEGRGPIVDDRWQRAEDRGPRTEGRVLDFAGAFGNI